LQSLKWRRQLYRSSVVWSLSPRASTKVSSTTEQNSMQMQSISECLGMVPVSKYTQANAAVSQTHYISGQNVLPESQKQKQGK